MYFVEFLLISWKKRKKYFLKRILLNVISNKNSCYK